jgi:hypothetical protein
MNVNNYKTDGRNSLQGSTRQARHEVPVQKQEEVMLQGCKSNTDNFICEEDCPG